MLLYDYLEDLPITFGEKNTILSIMTGLSNNYRNRNLTHAGYCSIAKKYKIPDDYKLPENYLDLMATVNKMVKDPSCPNNYKNRFYDYKGRIIKQAIKEGRVTDVYDEDPCVSLVVDGKYQFHQLKNSYAGARLTPIGKREYKHEDTAIPFDLETFTQFQLAALYYLGKVHYQKYGNAGDPKCNRGKKANTTEEPVYETDTIPLGVYLYRTHLSFSAKAAIASIIVNGNVDNGMTREEFNELVFQKRVPSDFKIPTNVLDLMDEVNKMVKDENCPKNLRNRFYRHKKQIIHAYSDDQKISDVWEERDTWSLLLDGKYRVHQPKRDHKKGYPKFFQGTRDFVEEESIPFDMEKYNQFQLAALYFLGKRDVKLKEAVLY